MAYDTEGLFEKAKQIIEKDDTIVFVDDVVCELGISYSTFYLHFPKDSDNSKEIKELLRVNKSKTKRQLRKQWKDVESSASLQISLYKLIATPEELERLNPPKQKEEEQTEKPKPLVNWINSDTKENE